MTELTKADALRLHGLHWLARVALRVRPTLRAKAVVDRFALPFAPLEGLETARNAVRTLFPAGSCLSRAIAVAAVIPHAEVVIGVDVWHAAQLAAHAWLEINGVRVDTIPGNAPPLPDELARLPSRSSSTLLRNTAKVSLRRN